MLRVYNVYIFIIVVFGSFFFESIRCVCIFRGCGINIRIILIGFGCIFIFKVF